MQKTTRPIVLNFQRSADKEEIRIKSYQEDNKKLLNDSNMGIGVQMPQEHRDARRTLSDSAKDEANLGKNTRIVGNKLYVDNKLTKKFFNGEVFIYE